MERGVLGLLRDHTVQYFLKPETNYQKKKIPNLTYIIIIIIIMIIIIITVEWHILDDVISSLNSDLNIFTVNIFWIISFFTTVN